MKFLCVYERRLHSTWFGHISVSVHTTDVLKRDYIFSHKILFDSLLSFNYFLPLNTTAALY